MGHELQTIASGIDFGEGPRWRDGRLWYSDFFQRAVYAVTLEGERERIVELDDQPSGLGWLPSGDLLIVSMTKRQVLRFDGSVLSLYADLSELASGHCNDMVVAPNGHAYVGNFGFAKDERAVPDATTLIHIDPAGSARLTGEPLQFPNGSVITRDGSTLIVAESVGQRLRAFEIESDGALSNERVFAEVPGRAPDGCTLDAEGAIWFADAGSPGHAVVRVAEGGEILDVIETPQPAFACMLGGDDLRTLFILTSTSTNQAKVAGKGPGHLLATRVDVEGAGTPQEIVNQDY